MSVSKQILFVTWHQFLIGFFPPCMSQSRTTGFESLGKYLSLLPIPWQYFITIWELQVKCVAGFSFWEGDVFFLYLWCSCSSTEFTKALLILGFQENNLAWKQVLWIHGFWSILLVPVTCYVVFAIYKTLETENYMISHFNLSVYSFLRSGNNIFFS